MMEKMMEKHAHVDIARPMSRTMSAIQMPQIFSGLRKTISILWLLTCSDFWNMVVPNTVFGICTSLATASLNTSNPRPAVLSLHTLGLAIGKVLLWNWLNCIIFNLANQRLPDSIEEDLVNKSWRPIPAGLLSPLAARRALLISIISVTAIAYFFLAAWEETLILVALTWIYNDLAGGDEHFAFRNLLVAVAVGVYNHASVRVASLVWNPPLPQDSMSCNHASQMMNLSAQVWILTIGLVWYTTIPIQDLRDVEGDRKRNRETMILALGSTLSRSIIAGFVIFWSLLVPFLLHLEIWNSYVLACIICGTVVMWRVLTVEGQKEDHNTMKLWALWMMTLYVMPLAAPA